jgi:hypothetical protein
MSANVRFYQFLADQANKLNEMRRRQQSSINNMFSNMSLGRMLGLAGGTLLGATMGMPLLGMAVAGGLGGRAGSELGRRFSNVDLVGDVKAYKQDAADERDKGIEALKQLTRKANVNMLTDAFSVYTLGSQFPKAAEGIAKWGADKSKFLGDWGARNLGIGGDQFGKEVTARALKDNQWLAQTQGLTEDQINDMFWNKWNPLDQAVGNTATTAKTVSPTLPPTSIVDAAGNLNTVPLDSAPVSSQPKGNTLLETMYNQDSNLMNNYLNATGTDLTSGTTLTPSTNMINYSEPYTMNTLYENEFANPYNIYVDRRKQ